MAAWELYQLCRQQQLIIYEKPTGDKKGTKILSTVLWPQGFSILPNNLGVDGENFIMMKYFHGFLMGERDGAVRLMAKKGR